MGVSTKELLNAALKSVLAAGEHHWAGKAVGTFVSEVAGAWETLPAEEREALEAAPGEEVGEALHGGALAARRSGLAAVGPEALDQLSAVLRGDLDEYLQGVSADIRSGITGLLRHLEPEIRQLAEGLRSARRTEAALLELRNDLLGELISLDEWQQGYWHRIAQGIPLSSLIEALGEEGYARLREGLVGRDRELADFQRFLTSKTGPPVLYHSGNPGCGKSRLAIEYGRLAESLGWPVFFVSERIEVDLSARLRDLGPEIDRLLLIWDDWQGGREEQLRDFLNLHDDPRLTGVRVQRVLTTWPQYARAVREATNVTTRLTDRPLAALDSDPGTVADVHAYLAALFPPEHRPDRSALTDLVRLSGGYPMALLLGLDLLVAGESLAALTGSEGIIGRSYQKLTQRLQDELGTEGVEAFRRLALVGRATVDDLEAEGVDEALPNFSEHRAALLRHGFVRFDEEPRAYVVEPDLLRQYVASVTLMGRSDHPLWFEEPTLGWREATRPFLPLWTSEIWAVTTSILDGRELLLDEVKSGMLGVIDEAIEASPPEEKDRCASWARSLFSATPVEPNPAERERLATRIEVLAERQPRPHRVIDRAWAMALHNATVGGSDPGERHRLAQRIEVIARRQPEPDHEIDLAWAQALYNATVGEPDPDKCGRLASCIAAVAERWPDPSVEIDRTWAMSLLNATAAASDPDTCRQLAVRIETILERRPEPDRDLDLILANALRNATVLEPRPETCRQLASRIEAIAMRQVEPDREIDLEWAWALVNTTVIETDPRERQRLAGILGEVAERRSTPDPEIDLQWSNALYNATVGEADPQERRRLAQRIEVIAERQPEPNREINLAWARALHNVTVREPDPGQCRRLAARIEAIAERQTEPDREIDLEWAKALVNSMVGEADPQEQRRVVESVEAIAERGEVPDVGLDRQWALALYNSTVVESDPLECLRLVSRIEGIAERQPGASPEIDLLWAKALCVTTAIDLSDRERRSVEALVYEILEEETISDLGTLDGGGSILALWALRNQGEDGESRPRIMEERLLPALQQADVAETEVERFARSWEQVEACIC